MHEQEPQDVLSGFWLAVILGWVGGFVDAFGFITLSNLFTAHMSGNSAALGAYLGLGDWTEALHRLTPIPLFVLGVAVGAAMIEIAARYGMRAAPTLALALEAILLLGFRLDGQDYLHGVTIRTAQAWQVDLLVALLAVAMGVQTAALQRICGTTVHTTFITGMLTNLAKEGVAYLFWLRDCRQKNSSAQQGIVPAQPSLFRAALMAGIWSAFLLGATTGGYAALHWALNALIAPLVILVLIISIDLWRGRPDKEA